MKPYGAQVYVTINTRDIELQRKKISPANSPEVYF